MPEDQTPTAEPTGISPEAVAVANAETVAKLEAQGRETLAKPEELARTSDALDQLLEKSIAEKKTAEATDAPDPAPVVPPVVKEPTPEEKAAADKAAADREEHVKRANEFFKDSPTLPAGASPKSSEAFSQVKIRAAQAIAERDSKLEEANKKIAEYETKLKDAVPPEVVAELEDHRQWRVKLDVDADPKFKEFDKQVTSAQEFVYAQLAKSPHLPQGIVEKIKALGGPENADLTKVYAAIKDPTLERIIQSKVEDIEQAKWNKEQAIASTKKNIGQYVADRQKAFQEGEASHNTETRKVFDTIASTFSWSKDLPVDPKADEPARKAAEAHNARAKEIRGQLEEALTDSSARMRAIMLTATAELIWRKSEFADRGAKLEEANKKVVELEAQLAKLKSASVGRLKEGGAAPGGRVEVKQKESDIFNKSASQALDDIARQVIEARRASA